MRKIGHRNEKIKQYDIDKLLVVQVFTLMGKHDQDDENLRHTYADLLMP